MAEPVTLFNADEQVTVHAPSEVRRLVAAGWGFVVAPRPLESSGDNNVLSDEEAVGAELNQVRRWTELDDEEPSPAWHEFDGLGLGDRVVEALVDAGLVTAAHVRGMTDEALLALDGVGPATVRKIRKVLE